MNDTEKQEIIEKLKTIKNIGPKMAEKLYNAGIYDFESLVRIGTEDVYLMVDESGGFCGTHHAAYLYAIEAAIINCRWQDVPEDRKNELKDFAKKLRETQ
jgi:DNA transformation protein